MSKRSQRLVLLLGAGASVPAGYPKTNEITDQVYSGEHVFRHSNQNYYINQDVVSTVPLQPDIEMICRTLEVIRPKRKGNYENLYDAIFKIRREYGNQYTPFKSDIIHYLKDLRLIIQSFRTDITFLPQESELLSNTLDYIEDITLEMILRNRGNESNTSYLNIYHQLLESDDIEGLDIFTLNHDTLIEDHIKNYPIIDGFQPLQDSGLSEWKPSLFNSPSEKSVRLFKLHGSIDWFWVSTLSSKGELAEFLGETVQSYRRFPFLAKVDDVSYARNEGRWVINGKDHINTEEGRPSLLIGQDAKLIAYSNSHYVEQLRRFKDSLEVSDAIIIVGYSWQDSGVTRLIDDWQMGTENKKLLYITLDEYWKEVANTRTPFSIITPLYKDFREVNLGEIITFIEDT